MTHMQIRRVLAIDVRSHRVGYAVFEVPARLVDWGVKKNVERLGAIANHLRMLQPSVVLLRRVKSGSKRDTAGARSIMHAIRSDMRKLSIPVQYLSESGLKNFFRTYGSRTKYQRASLLAVCFPELKWQLPPRRKIWKAEHLRMSIFDAVQLGVAFLAASVDAEAIAHLLTKT